MVEANSDLPGRFFFNLTHKKNSRCRQSHAGREGCGDGAFPACPSFPRLRCTVRPSSSSRDASEPPFAFPGSSVSCFRSAPSRLPGSALEHRHRSTGSVFRRNGHQVTMTREAGISRSSPEPVPRPPKAGSPRHGSLSCVQAVAVQSLQNLPLKPEMRTLEQPLFCWLRGVEP